MNRFLSRLFSIAFLAVLGNVAVASTPYAYVSNIAGNNVTVVNTTNGSITGSISVPGGPNGLAVSPDGTTLYVVSLSGNRLFVISTATNAVIAIIGVGATPIHVAISPTGAVAYVVNQGSDSVSVINTDTNSVTATIGVGSHPTGVAFSPDGSRAYVTNVYGSSVSLIDTTTNSVRTSFSTGAGPASVAISPNGAYAYVANQYDGTVTVHSAANGSIAATIAGFNYPNSLAITPDGSSVFVTNGNAGSVSVVDTSSNSIIANIPTGTLPSSVAISTDGTAAYVTNEFSLSLSIVSTSTFALTNTVARVGVFPVAVAMMPPPASSVVCTYAISPGSASFGANGGTGKVSVTAPSGCGWTASSNASWASITAGASGSGNGTVNYSVNSDNTASGQNGSLTIAGQTFTLTESGLSCSYSLSSTSASLGSGGGAGTVTVTAPSGCLWSAASNSSFLSITSGASGNGTGTMGYLAASNTAAGSLSGTLTIASQTFTVTEAGVSFSPILVNCGGPAFTDANNNVWAGDNTGNVSSTTNAIANTSLPQLYQSEKWSTGTLQYQYAVPNGSYNVTLKFAEFYLTRRGERLFDIVINGGTFQSSFDILVNTSPNTAYDLTVPVVVTNGKITIQLVPVMGPAKLNGLEIDLQ